MTICRDIKSFSRTHEHIADFFSLLALALLGATVWAILTYYQPLLEWMQVDSLLRTAAVIGALVLDVALFLGLLMLGSARFGQDNERCFGTFRGRRARHGEDGMLKSWIDHMENVSKKHR